MQMVASHHVLQCLCKQSPPCVVHQAVTDPRPLPAAYYYNQVYFSHVLSHGKCKFIAYYALSFIHWLIFVRPLRKLSILHGSIDIEGANLLARILSHPNCTLESLELSHVAISPDVAETLARAMHAYARLQSLGVVHCSLGNAGADALALAITGSLRYLGLPSNSIRSAPALMAALAESHISTIDVSYNPLGDAGTRALTAALSRAQSMQIAMLQSIEATTAAASAIGELLCASNIEAVGLANNALHSSGLASIATSIASCPNSTANTLDLSGNGLNDVACGAVGSLLRTLPGLKHIYLSMNNLGDECVSLLLPALVDHRTLARLDLSYNRIGIESALKFVGLLDQAQHPPLVFLDLKRNGLPEHVIHSIHNRIKAAAAAAAAEAEAEAEADTARVEDGASPIVDPSPTASRKDAAAAATDTQDGGCEIVDDAGDVILDTSMTAVYFKQNAPPEQTCEESDKDCLSIDSPVIHDDEAGKKGDCMAIFAIRELALSRLDALVDALLAVDACSHLEVAALLTAPATLHSLGSDELRRLSLVLAQLGIQLSGRE
jgi:Ran GTPase-activating protein (RanGAP) involved in mRNA processing and transport